MRVTADRHTPPTRQTDEAAAAAAAAGRAAASVELGRDIAEQHMTPEQRKRVAELRARSRGRVTGGDWPR